MFHWFVLPDLTCGIISANCFSAANYVHYWGSTPHHMLILVIIKQKFPYFKAEARIVGIISFHHSKEQATLNKFLQDATAIRHTKQTQWADMVFKRRVPLTILTPTPSSNNCRRPAAIWVWSDPLLHHPLEWVQ